MLLEFKITSEHCYDLQLILLRGHVVFYQVYTPMTMSVIGEGDTDADKLDVRIQDVGSVGR